MNLVSRNKSAQRSKQAFTLVEVMIAIALFGMVLTAIYTSWSSILRGSKIGRDAAEQVQEIRMTMSCLNQSLSGVQMFAANEMYYSFEGYADGDNSILSFVSTLSDSFVGAGFFPGEPVRRVSFFVGSNDSGEAQLFMQQVPVLVDVETEVEPYTVGLAEGVTFFEALYWDEQEEDWFFEWTMTNQMPTMVQFRLGLQMSDGRSGKIERTYSKLVAIPSVAIQEDWQRPNPQNAAASSTGRLPNASPNLNPGVNPGQPGTSGRPNRLNPGNNLNQPPANPGRINRGR